MNALNLIQFESSLVFADAPAAGMSVGAIIGIIIGAVILLIFFFSFFPVGLAISAGASGVHVGLFQLVGMRIRKVNPHRIVEPLIKATKAGLDLNLNKMEAHYLAGGNVDRVVNALIASQRAGIELDFEKACDEVSVGDFVYFDPPYDTWDDKESFTSYDKNAFGKDEQVRLANVYKQLSKKGVYVMLSNHNTSFIRELYSDFHINVVPAKRMINANGKGRGYVEEVLITNYE